MSDGVIVVEDEYLNGSPRKSGSPLASRSSDRGRARSRSRSPVNRQKLYDSEGTNTTSEKPHLMRARLFVGNVNGRSHRSDLRRIFSRYGEVLGVSIHKGYAFVQMDRERHANLAILGEDNNICHGSRLHVEFSQAAKKAGARFEESMGPRRSRSPVRSRERDPIVDKLEEREARLAKVLAMEKELAYLRSQEQYSRRPPSDYYDRRDSDRHHDYSPPPRDYDARDRGYDRRDQYYDRQSPQRSPPVKPSAGGYRDYPAHAHKRQSGYEPRESSYGRGGEPNVGYGSSSGGRMTGGKASGGAPPGWPGYSKANPNQRPFSNSTPWN